MRFSNKNSTVYLLYFSLLLACLTQIFAMANWRILSVESAAMLFDSLTKSNIPYAGARYLEILFNAPAYWLGHNLKNDWVISTAAFVYGFFHIIHHFISLFICYRILQTYDKLHLLKYPLLSFCLSTLLALPWIGTAVVQINSLIWPIAIAILFCKPNVKVFIPVVFGVIALSISHEGALVVLIMLSVLLIRLILTSSRFRMYFGTLLFFILAAVASCVYRFANTDYPTASFFKPHEIHTLSYLYDPIVIFALATLFYWLLVECTDIISIRISWIFAIITTSVALYFFNVDINTISQMRIPAFWFNVFIFGVFLSKIFLSMLNRSGVSHLQTPIILMALIFMCVRDVQLTRNWIVATEFLSSQLNTDETCIEISPENLEYKGTVISPGAFSPIEYYSLLLARTSKPRQIAIYKNSYFNCDFVLKNRYVPIENFIGRRLDFNSDTDYFNFDLISASSP